MSNLIACYTRILSALHELEDADNFLDQRRIPKFSDKELLALNLAAECLGIDSERYLFKRLPDQITSRIERSVFNRRKRRLSYKLDRLRQQLADQIIINEQYHIVDSMPLEVCKWSRSKRSTVCQEHEDIIPDYGYCAAQKTGFYGFKMHAVCTVQGVFKSLAISPASTHDIHYLEQVKSQFSDCVLIGDRGYVSQAYQHDLFTSRQIKLEVPMRRNQYNYKPFSTVLRKARKRIETLYSQLCDQFMIRRNYAKSFQGFSTRIISKITALTMIQWLNKLDGRHINNIKIAVT